MGTGGNEAGHCSSLGRRMHTDHKTTVVWSPVSEPVALSPRRSVARDARPLLERGAQSGAGCGSPGRYPQRTSVASLPGSARVRPRYSSRVRLHGRRSRRVPLPARGTLLRCTSPGGCPPPGARDRERRRDCSIAWRPTPWRGRSAPTSPLSLKSSRGANCSRRACCSSRAGVWSSSAEARLSLKGVGRAAAVGAPL